MFVLSLIHWYVYLLFFHVKGFSIMLKWIQIDRSIDRKNMHLEYVGDQCLYMKRSNTYHFRLVIIHHCLLPFSAELRHTPWGTTRHWGLRAAHREPRGGEVGHCDAHGVVHHLSHRALQAALAEGCWGQVRRFPSKTKSRYYEFIDPHDHLELEIIKHGCFNLVYGSPIIVIRKGRISQHATLIKGNYSSSFRGE